MIPNQVFINKMFAMCFYHLQLTSFPKAVYNADIIDTFSNEIGQAIPISGVPPEMNIKNVAGYLEPSQMSTQINQVIDLAYQYTRESLGVNDAVMGTAEARNTSAIISLQKSSAVPLENPKGNLYQWIEDIGYVLFDMMGTYYGLRPVVITDENGMKQMVQYDFSIFKELYLNVRSDVGETSYWSEIAAMQTLTNLLQGQHIDIIEFLERTRASTFLKKKS